MTELIPYAIDLGQYHIVGLVDVDRIRGWHPAGTPRHPEDFGPISFGIEEVAADRAGVIDDVLDAIALGDQAPVEDAEIVETGHPHRDLLDQMRVLHARSSPHERDLVVYELRICAQEDDAGAPVLLCDLHAHDVPVEGDHPLQVAHVDSDVSKPRHPRHDVSSRAAGWSWSRWPKRILQRDRPARGAMLETLARWT